MEQLLDNRKADLIAALENALLHANAVSYDNDEARFGLASAFASARRQLQNITDLMNAYDDDETETIVGVILPLMED